MITKPFGKESIFRLHGTAPVLASLLLALTCEPQLTNAGEAPVPLGRAGNFAVLAGSTVTSTGATIVNGDLGVSPGTAVTGFPPGIVNGTIHAGDAVAAGAQTDLTIAYNDAAGRSTAPILISGNLGGRTLTPGLYKSATSLEISAGDLTLDAQGDSSAVFIFQMASTFVTTSGRQVILAGGARAENIFWQVGSSATIGTTSVMKGNILADQSITLATGATLGGKALARIAAVTMDSNVVTSNGANPPNNPPGCGLGISCAFTLTGHSNASVIALNGSRACVVLDASGASADNSQIAWLVDGTLLQGAARITNCLSIGCHSVVLTVSGATGCETKTNLCVITAASAVDQLISIVDDADLGTTKKGHGYKGCVDKLVHFASLKAAAAAFDEGHFNAGINQLQAFQRNVHIQFGRTHPASAALLIASAQTILDALDCSARMILTGVVCHHRDHGHSHEGHHGDGDDDDHDGGDSHDDGKTKGRD